MNDKARAADLDKLPRPSTLASLSSTTFPFDYRTNAAFQVWFTDVIAPVLQPKALAAIRSWLTEAPSNAHLYVEGPPNRGRLAIISTLARQAMAQVPAPLDYCYVPDPDALDRQRLLAFPPGTASWCEKLISLALDEILRELGPQESSRASEQGETAAIQPSSDTSLAQLLAALPESARAYIHELQDVLARFRALPTRITLAQAEAVPTPDVGPGGPHIAPLVIGHDYGRSLELALLHARGGILVLDASQLANGWSALYPTLQSRSMQYLKAGGPSTPCPVRVVVIGTNDDYLIASGLSSAPALPGFSALFRYRALFEDQIAWNVSTKATCREMCKARMMRSRRVCVPIRPTCENASSGWWLTVSPCEKPPGGLG
jgi:hypothetical protein